MFITRFCNHTYEAYRRWYKTPASDGSWRNRNGSGLNEVLHELIAEIMPQLTPHHMEKNVVDQLINQLRQDVLNASEPKMMQDNVYAALVYTSVSTWCITQKIGTNSSFQSDVLYRFLQERNINLEDIKKLFLSLDIPTNKLPFQGQSHQMDASATVGPSNISNGNMGYHTLPNTSVTNYSTFSNNSGIMNQNQPQPQPPQPQVIYAVPAAAPSYNNGHPGYFTTNHNPQTTTMGPPPPGFGPSAPPMPQQTSPPQQPPQQQQSPQQAPLPQVPVVPMPTGNSTAHPGYMTGPDPVVQMDNTVNSGTDNNVNNSSNNPNTSASNNNNMVNNSNNRQTRRDKKTEDMDTLDDLINDKIFTPK